MAYRVPVHTSAAALPLPHYSQAVKYNGLIYCSGSIGTDPKTDELISGSVTDRTRMAIQNLSVILQEGGSSLERVLKATVYLTNMADFDAMNKAWDEFFTHDPKPVSSAGWHTP
ncbi:unnamed protein product [Penicillium salamii]|nr:unnamed protein product [Penicillium salamii]CAG8013152.1 unnamed protein product [Penicillium salamii]